MRKFTILIAEDDDTEFAELQCGFAFLPLEHHIQRVKNGKLLLQFLSGLIEYKQKLPDLIMLKSEMPEVNGIETLELIKVNSYFSNVPVMIYTTILDKGQEEKCNLLNAASYLRKGKSAEEVKAFASRIHEYIITGILTHTYDSCRNATTDAVTF